MVMLVLAVGIVVHIMDTSETLTIRNQGPTVGFIDQPPSTVETVMMSIPVRILDLSG